MASWLPVHSSTYFAKQWLFNIPTRDTTGIITARLRLTRTVENICITHACCMVISLWGLFWRTVRGPPSPLVAHSVSILARPESKMPDQNVSQTKAMRNFWTPFWKPGLWCGPTVQARGATVNSLFWYKILCSTTQVLVSSVQTAGQLYHVSRWHSAQDLPL